LERRSDSLGSGWDMIGKWFRKQSGGAGRTQGIDQLTAGKNLSAKSLDVGVSSKIEECLC
jgi:hypothetical protein